MSRLSGDERVVIPNADQEVQLDQKLQCQVKASLKHLMVRYKSIRSDIELEFDPDGK